MGWVAQSKLSEVHEGTGFWDEEGNSSERGIYCLNRTAGVDVGEKHLGLGCWTPNCPRCKWDQIQSGEKCNISTSDSIRLFISRKRRSSGKLNDSRTQNDITGSKKTQEEKIKSVVIKVCKENY